MAVFLVKWDAMVAIPSIEHSFSSVGWDGTYLVERGLGVMSLPCCMVIQGLKVNRAPGFARLLGTHYHPVAPCDRRANWNRFYDTKSYILV